MATNQMRREAAKRKLENQQKRREERARRRKRNATIASVVTVVVVVAAAVGVYLYANAPEVDAAAMPARGDCSYVPGEPASKPVTPPADGTVPTEGTVAAALDTSAGPIDLTLDRGLAPCTVNSFVNLAQKGFFNGTGCHRLTTGPGLQVLQCGDPTGSGSGGPGYSFADEVSPDQKYGRGVLAMANSGPNTNGSQFFMIYGEAQLPPQYTAFGSIGPRGLTTLSDVAKARPAGAEQDGPPERPVEIRTATVT